MCWSKITNDFNNTNKYQQQMGLQSPIIQKNKYLLKNLTDFNNNNIYNFF